jgi:hypothetical protein
MTDERDIDMEIKLMDNIVTCHSCGYKWNYAENPTPAYRCPKEADHKPEETSAERDNRRVMFALCKSLGWDIETDGEGSYVIYPGIANPEWDRGYCV